MASQKVQQVTLSFPKKGVDRSMPVAEQPDLTCPDAVNVRTFTALGDRATGGKRSGTIKAFDVQAGESATRQGAGLIVVPRTVVEPTPTTGTWEPYTDDFSRYIVIGGAGITNTKAQGNYTIHYRRRNAAWTVGSDAANWTFGYGGTLNATSNLDMGMSGSTSLGAPILSVNYPTKNQIRVRIQAYPQATTTDVQAGVSYEPTYTGPFVRGSVGKDSFFVAYLQCVGQNQVQLAIDKHAAGTVTRIATSQRTLALSGIAQSDAFCTLELSANETTLRASVNWPKFMTPDADSLVVESNTDLASNNCAGVWFGMGDGVSSAARRSLAYLAYSRLMPAQTDVVAELMGGTYPPGSLAYYLPDGLTSAYVVSGTTNTTVGPYNSAADPGNSRPLIVTANNQVRGGVNRAAATYLITPTAAPTERLAVETRFTDTSATGDDNIGFCTRIHTGNGGTAFSNMLKVLVTRKYSSGVTAEAQSWFTTIKVYQVINGAPTQIGSTYTYNGSGSTQAPTFSTQQPVRFIDDGTNLKLLVNGLEWWSVNPTGLSSYSTSGGWDNMAMRVGADFNGDAAQCYANGVRFVKANPPSVTTVVSGTDAVAFTSAAVDVGDFSNTAFLSRCSGGGLTGSNVEATILNNKVYAVDGTKPIIVDPILKKVTTWAATKGTLPDKCELVCTYRGRIVLARPAANKAQAFMSRVNDPLDWEYGSTNTVSTKAYALTAADVGQPPEPITALAPYQDDYLIIGCERAIYMMEGDPGAGGSLQVVSQGTGILGPRAWCFDDQGSLYFMGSSGLYVMARNTRDYQPIGHRRLVQFLDRVNLATTKIQMAYDAFKSCVHIFLTPLDTTVQGTHVVYQPPMDAFWIDKYPTAFGPYALARMHGQADEDRRFVFIGSDGYIRRPSDTARSDDGTSITTQVRFPALELAGGSVESMATEVQAHGVDGSGPLSWSWLTAGSCDQVNRADPSTAVRSGVWFTDADGFQRGTSLRVRGGAHQLVVTQDSATDAWGLEHVMAWIRPESRRR